MFARIIGVVLVVGACALSVTLVLAGSNDRPISVDPRWADYRSQMSITWSDRVFVDKRIAQFWLDTRAHGYGVWAERHPPAARRLETRSR